MYWCLVHGLLANEHPREWMQLLAVLPEKRENCSVWAAVVMESAIKACMSASSLIESVGYK